MTTAAARPRLLPPVVLLAALVAMVALHLTLPLRAPIVWPWRWAGAPLVVLGVALVLHVALLFRRAGTTIKPFEESSALVVTGPYRISRNPIYASMAVALAGVALLLGSLSPWLVIPIFVLVLDRRFVAREEAMLRERFGAEYEAYAGRVRRWI